MRLAAWSASRSAERALALPAALLVVFLLAPLLGLFTRLSWADFKAGLESPLVGPALRLSLCTTSVSLLVNVVLGTPLAYLLSRSRSRLWHGLEVLLELPIVIPPAVAGVALLLTFGRRGILAPLLYPEGFGLTFTSAAVVLAEVFVSAPFFVRAATSAFRALNPDLPLVARSLGASAWRVFFGIALPLCARGVLVGAALAWARSLAEFGATLMFAGNLPGTTQTLPLAIYTAMESDLRVAQALSVLLVGVAALLLVSMRVGLSVVGAKRLAGSS
ncbi:MAG: ABC transporter permease [Hyphomonadaceae bacterium]